MIFNFNSLLHKLHRRLWDTYGKLFFSSLSPVLRKGRINSRDCDTDVSLILINHFKSVSDSDNRASSFQLVANHISGTPSLAGKSFVETGSSAWGLDSTHLIDQFALHFNTSFFSVDIRYFPSKVLRKTLHSCTTLVTSDSIVFLNTLPDNSIAFAYLDSWDTDWDNFLPSALHGLHEFLTILPKMAQNSIILIDDTPMSPEQLSVYHSISESYMSAYSYFFPKNILPGKGGLVQLYCEANAVRYKKLGYQLVVYL